MNRHHRDFIERNFAEIIQRDAWQWRETLTKDLSEIDFAAPSFGYVESGTMRLHYLNKSGQEFCFSKSPDGWSIGLVSEPIIKKETEK